MTSILKSISLSRGTTSTSSRKTSEIYFTTETKTYKIGGILILVSLTRTK